MQAAIQTPRPVSRARVAFPSRSPLRSLPIWLALVALGTASAITIADRRGEPVTELGHAMGGEVTTSALPGTV